MSLEDALVRHSLLPAEQWLQSHPEAGSSWPNWPKASYARWWGVSGIAGPTFASPCARSVRIKSVWLKVRSNQISFAQEVRFCTVSGSRGLSMSDEVVVGQDSRPLIWGGCPHTPCASPLLESTARWSRPCQHVKGNDSFITPPWDLVSRFSKPSRFIFCFLASPKMGPASPK